MSQRMYKCPRCLNKVRQLYEWKNGIHYCNVCQQENIERYEATIIYRFFLFFRLVAQFIKGIFGEVIFPYQGIPRRLVRTTLLAIKELIHYVQLEREQARIRKAKR